MPPSKDYEKFNTKVTGDVSQASFHAQSLDNRSVRTKVRIRESCIESLIPSHSAVEIEQLTFHNLKFGDIVLVRDKKEFVIRRFIRFEVRGVDLIVIHVVNQHWKIAEEFRDSAIQGRIRMVESKGVVFNPYKKESFGARLRNRLTYFGTSSPWQRLMSSANIVGSMLKRPKF